MHRRLTGTVALAVAAAACWWGWLAWHRTYLRDPVTGAASGPYEAWQVAGCVLCLVAVTVVATTRLPLWIVVPVVPAAFTAAWALSAASDDTTGLWALGAVLVLIATAAGTVLVCGATAAARRVIR